MGICRSGKEREGYCRDQQRQHPQVRQPVAANLQESAKVTLPHHLALGIFNDLGGALRGVVLDAVVVSF